LASLVPHYPFFFQSAFVSPHLYKYHLQNFTSTGVPSPRQFIYQGFNFKNCFFARLYAKRADSNDLSFCVVGIGFYGAPFSEYALRFETEAKQIVFLLAFGYRISSVSSTQCRAFLDQWSLFMASVGFLRHPEKTNHGKWNLFFNMFLRSLGVEYL